MAAPTPRLTGGLCGGHDGQPCDIAPTFCWETDSDDKTRLGTPRRQHLKILTRSRALYPVTQGARDNEAFPDII